MPSENYSPFTNVQLCYYTLTEDALLNKKAKVVWDVHSEKKNMGGIMHGMVLHLRRHHGDLRKIIFGDARPMKCYCGIAY